MELFIPGRLCLFGEHSDWAAQYRLINSNIYPGYAIVVGTNQGIYARVKPDRHLHFKSICHARVFESAMERTSLLKIAKINNFYSYVAGVAYEALRRYQVNGLAIDNYKMNLPLKKGLSSSAAICVLVARAFNRVYGLNLTIEEEMELAYYGERQTASQCGRLDQACAYGGQPVAIAFDGNDIEIQPLNVGRDLHLIIVDLAGNKDTQKILADLNQCYPVADNAIKAEVQNYLGNINAEIVKKATLAIERGNSIEIGNLMNLAQSEFDRRMIPACQSELNAPILHRLLAHSPLQEHIYGGKGVGSQGDGTAQFIAKDLNSQQEAIAIIQRDFPQMRCYELNISKTEAIDLS